MKTKIFALVIMTCIHGLSLSEEPLIRVTKEKLPSSGNSAPVARKPDAEFRIKSLDANLAIPDLTIPAYSYGMRTRIVDARVSKKRMEIAIQLDELGIDYYDYKLEEGRWVLQSKKRVCSLSGALALALAQVDICEGGVVEMKYREGRSVIRKSSWDNELINKDHKANDKLLSERYALKEGGFRLAGKPVRLRPNTDISQTTEEQNKAQHPTDGTVEQEKPEE
jgi:hypothetical protein